MDDECSVLSSCYFDTTSITSDSTIPADLYHTPTGSLIDINDCGSDNQSSELTPTLNNLKIIEDDSKEDLELDQSKHLYVENEYIVKTNNEFLSSAPLIEKEPAVIEINEASNDPPPKKRNWKHNFLRRLSIGRSRIMRSFSIPKCNRESRTPKNIFQSLRHSIRRRSFDKKPNTNKIVEKNSSASVVLGSDCDYFNFEKDLDMPDLVLKDDIRAYTETECFEGTPIKPRRQFTQEKYLTGSEEVLQKAFNSLKRKSHLQDNKSLFDICSTVSHVFIDELSEDPLPNEVDLKFPKFIDNCVNSFLNVHGKQIDKSIEMINETIGQHIDLYSEDLDLINKSKKYQITELFGTKGVCVITNLHNKKQFIALKRNCSKSWIFFTSFLQHNENSVNLLPDQKWICFPAQSITNLYIEKHFFSSIHLEFQLLLDAVMQLVVILYCEMMNNSDVKINPFNVMLISSDLSIIFIFVESNEDNNIANVDEEWFGLRDSIDNDIRQTYQGSLRQINKYMARFLSLPENISHLIKASYPLDYLFYLLLKLNKDSVLINNM